MVGRWNSSFGKVHTGYGRSEDLAEAQLQSARGLYQSRRLTYTGRKEVIVAIAILARGFDDVEV